MNNLFKKVEGYEFVKYSDNPTIFFDGVKESDVTPFDKDFWLGELSKFAYYENLDELGGLFTPPTKKTTLLGDKYDHSKRIAPFVTAEVDVNEFKLGAFRISDALSGVNSGLTAYGITTASGVLFKSVSGGLVAFSGKAATELIKRAGWVGVIVAIGVPLVCWVLRGDSDHLLAKALQSYVASTVGARGDKFLRKLDKSRDELTPFELSLILTLQQFGFAFVDKDDYFVPVIWNPDELNSAVTVEEMRASCMFYISKKERGKNAKFF